MKKNKKILCLLLILISLLMILTGVFYMINSDKKVKDNNSIKYKKSDFFGAYKNKYNDKITLNEDGTCDTYNNKNGYKCEWNLKKVELSTSSKNDYFVFIYSIYWKIESEDNEYQDEFLTKSACEEYKNTKIIDDESTKCKKVRIGSGITIKNKNTLLTTSSHNEITNYKKQK